MQWKLNDTVICLLMGKTWWQKPHRVIFRSPLPKLHYYHNKRLQVKESQVPYQPTVPYPNTQLDLFCSDSSPFGARLPSTWLTNCANPSMRLQSPTKKVVGCKVLQFIHKMKIKKMLSHKIQWCTYTTTSSQEWWTRARTSSPVTICLNKVFSMLVQLVNLLMALKIILLYI